MAACKCVPPPPVFDVPPLPDPSLIWHLLSNETAEELEKVYSSDCEHNPLLALFGLSADDSVEVHHFLPYVSILLLVVFAASCSIFAVIMKRKGRRRKNLQAAKTLKPAPTDSIVFGDRIQRLVLTDNAQKVRIVTKDTVTSGTDATRSPACGKRLQDLTCGGVRLALQTDTYGRSTGGGSGTSTFKNRLPACHVHQLDELSPYFKLRPPPTFRPPAPPSDFGSSESSQFSCRLEGESEMREFSDLDDVYQNGVYEEYFQIEDGPGGGYSPVHPGVPGSPVHISPLSRVSELREGEARESGYGSHGSNCGGKTPALPDREEIKAVNSRTNQQRGSLASPLFRLDLSLA
ncbi:hypothetical protein AAVH_26351 [Aphelenchoides avenae]|nr:hypothetical protein AAVH_26351 [Aphelenchus avenae]